MDNGACEYMDYGDGLEVSHRLRPISQWRPESQSPHFSWSYEVPQGQHSHHELFNKTGMTAHLLCG